MFDQVKSFTDAYPAAYQILYQAKPITCSVTGTTFSAVSTPCAVILDVSVQTTVNNSSWIILPFSFLLLVLFIPSIAHY